MIKHNIVSRDEIKGAEERLVKKWIALPSEITMAEKYILKRLDYDVDISKGDEPLVVGGPCSVAVLDKESHLITTKALEKAFDKFMLNPSYANIQFQHTDLQVAQALPFWVGKNGDIYKSGVVNNYLYLLSALRDDIEVAGRTAKEIRDGNIRSYSIAGSVLDKELKSTAGKVFYQINGLELGEVSYCANPVNPQAHFEILKGDDDKIELSSVLEQFTEPIRLTDYTVALVGGVVKKGESENDIDLVIRADENSFIGRAIRLRLSRDFPDIRKKLSFIYEQEGPHGSFVPLYHLQLVPNSQTPEVVRLGDDDNDAVGKRLGDPKTDVERLKEHFGDDWKGHDVSELPERGEGLKELKECVGKQKAPSRPGLKFDPIKHRWISTKVHMEAIHKPKEVANRLGKLPTDEVGNIVRTLAQRIKEGKADEDEKGLWEDATEMYARRMKVRGVPESKVTVKGLVAKLIKQGVPPRSGLTFDPVVHRWIRPQTLSQVIRRPEKVKGDFDKLPEKDVKNIVDTLQRHVKTAYATPKHRELLDDATKELERRKGTTHKATDLIKNLISKF